MYFHYLENYRQYLEWWEEFLILYHFVCLSKYIIHFFNLLYHMELLYGEDVVLQIEINNLCTKQIFTITVKPATECAASSLIWWFVQFVYSCRIP